MPSIERKTSRKRRLRIKNQDRKTDPDCLSGWRELNPRPLDPQSSVLPKIPIEYGDPRHIQLWFPLMPAGRSEITASKTPSISRSEVSTSSIPGPGFVNSLTVESAASRSTI